MKGLADTTVGTTDLFRMPLLFDFLS